MHKIFKKALTCAMAGALCLTMAIPAFADDADTDIVDDEENTSTEVAPNADDYDACFSTAMDIIEGTGEELTAETLIQMLMDYGFSEETATEVAYSDYIAGFLVSEDQNTEDEDGEDSSSNENAGSEGTESDGEEYATCEEAALEMIATRESMGEEISREELIDSLVALGFSKDLATQVVDELLGEEKSENGEDEEETGLGIAMTTDKTEYSVNESIFYTVEMSEQTKNATESDVIVSDELPEGIHVKDVTVDGSDDAIVTISANKADKDADSENASEEESNDKTEQSYVATVVITVEDKDAEYIFRNIVSGDAYENVLVNSEEQVDADGNVTYVQTYTLYGDSEGEHNIDVWMLADGAEKESLFLQTEATFSEVEETNEDEGETVEKESVQVYIPTVDYDEPVVVTIEAYADEAGTYTNTAVAVSAESEAVSASATIDVVGETTDGSGTVVSSEPDSTTGNEGTGTDNGGKITADDNGGKDSGTIQTGDVKTDSTVNVAMLSAIGLTACIGLGASIAVAKKAKAN